MSELQIIESSSFGGKLTVRETEFELVFPFVGPDPRYNKFYLAIKDAMLRQYICAWEENWHTFQLMRTAMPSMEFTLEGRLGMRLTPRGVFLHMLCVASEAELKKMLTAFQNALSRGHELQREIRMQAGRPPAVEEEK